jgi:hypothetical protein
MMTKLSQIKGDGLAAATAVIDPIFEKCCRIMEGHSQPHETLSVRPTLEELEKDWAHFRQRAVPTTLERSRRTSGSVGPVQAICGQRPCSGMDDAP